MARLHGSLEILGLAGLGEKLVRRARRSQRRLLVRLTRQNDARNPGIVGQHTLQKVGAVHRQHAHVGHDDVELLRLERLQGFLGPLGEMHVPLPAHRAKHAPESLQDVRLVVDEHNPSHAATSSAVSTNGSVIVKRVPRPTVDSTEIDPP